MEEKILKKTYILDTNILLSDPRAIFGFDDNHVVITQTTLQELDSKKNAMGELGYNAREAIRTIESLRKDADNNDVTNETKLETGGTFQVVPDDTEYLPSTFSKERPDNRIIGTALYLQKLKKSIVVLVTNDVSMRINASAAHFNDVEEYRNDHVPKDSENYTGIYTYDCDTKSGKELIQALESNFINGLSIEDVSIIGGIDFTGHEFHENEFAVFKCEQRDVVTIYRHGSLYIVNLKNKVFGVQPKNVHQIAALHALSAPVQDIPLVILKGSAGCVDADTEFFNGKEWKRIADWNKDDQVLQFDTNTEQASLVTPNAYIKLPCDKMYHFETKYGIDQTLSPEHRVIYYNRATKHEGFNGPYEISAQEMIDKMNESSFHGKFRTTFGYSGPGIDLSDIEIKLMCAVICDGTFNKNNPNSKRCTLNLKRLRKIEEARNLLNESGLEYKETDMENGYVRFMFNAPRREKEFSSYWYNCTQHQLQIVCKNILRWDGSTTRRKTFSQANKTTIDFVQFAFASCGYRTAVSKCREKGEIKITNGKEYERKHDLYNLSITTRSYVGVTSGKARSYRKTVVKEIVPVDGYKYCFNVSSHALVLRRNGKIFVTGNCAKTFLSLAAGLDTTFNSMYHKVLISRNNVMADAEFGFLPGSINEKMTPLLAPFYDNLENLYRNYEPNESDEEINGEIDDLFESKKIDICPLAYMRGRSITHSYLIVDEVQNATRSQIRDIITRAGEGTKIVLCGDPGQVDAHNLDRYNNGLVFAAQRFIDSPLCAQITFTSETCVRSELAKEASDLLQF